MTDTVQAAATTTSDVLLPVAQAGGALLVEWFQPFNVLLLAAVIGFAWFLRQSNKQPDFHMVDSLRGDNGQASAGRVVFYGAFIASTWALMQCAGSWLSQPQEFGRLFAFYVLAWALPKVLEKFIEYKYGKKDNEAK